MKQKLLIATVLVAVSVIAFVSCFLRSLIVDEFGATTVTAFAAETVDLVVGTVQLPAGFKHTRGQGDDSIVGHFTSPDGLEIRYDIGPMAGVYATHPSHKPLVSSAELKVGDLTGLLIVFGTTTQTVVVSFPTIGPTNFFAQIRNKNDMEAVKKLAMTFKPKPHDNKH